MSAGGRRALVTGASRGIGRAIAVALAADGHQVIASARGEAGLQGTVEAGAGLPGAVAPLTADMARPEDCAALVGRAGEALGGPPEIVVYCAGVARAGAVADLTLADWNESMQVNVTGAFQVVQPAIPAMVEARWGRIVNIASLYARFAAKHAGAYAASKHAMLGLTRTLSAELVQRGVTANAIVPGFVDTEMVRDEADLVATARGIEPEEAIKLFLRIQPLGRLIEPREVGALTAFLCGEDAGAISGQAYGIDGGAYQA
jgi:NAD(P)-dependent dehydrogenase (short-subunit alcohol dehydrogenase family)